MNEIKKEWLIDRAEYMFAEIEDEIARLQRSRDKKGRYAKEERNGDNIS